MFNSPEDAEDAYYDALENNDTATLSKIWIDGQDCFTLLPMMPPAIGKAAVEDAYKKLLEHTGNLDLTIKHIHWIKQEKFAVHLSTENITSENGQPATPIYTVNSYVNEPDGWRMFGHQNAPGQPPQLHPAP